MIERHLLHLTRLNRRPGTIRQRQWCLERLTRFLDCGILDADLQDLRNFVTRTELAPETRAAEVSHLRGFYRWAFTEGFIAVDPTVRLERPARPRHLPRPMRQDHVDYALAFAPEPVNVWFHLAAYAGLRACEIGPLRGEDVRGAMLVIREQKGGDEGTVPLAPILQARLGRFPQAGWVFPHRGPGPPGPTSAGQVQRHANRWLHAHDIPETLHTLRHYYGTMIYRVSGHDLRLTQELLRHRSPASTAIYTALDPERGPDVVSRLPGAA